METKRWYRVVAWVRPRCSLKDYRPESYRVEAVSEEAAKDAAWHIAASAWLDVNMFESVTPE